LSSQFVHVRLLRVLNKDQSIKDQVICRDVLITKTKTRTKMIAIRLLKLKLEYYKKN